MACMYVFPIYPAIDVRIVRGMIGSYLRARLADAYSLLFGLDDGGGLLDVVLGERVGRTGYVHNRRRHNTKSASARHCLTGLACSCSCFVAAAAIAFRLVTPSSAVSCLISGSRLNVTVFFSRLT